MLIVAGEMSERQRSLLDHSRWPALECCFLWYNVATDLHNHTQTVSTVAADLCVALRSEPAMASWMVFMIPHAYAKGHIFSRCAYHKGVLQQGGILIHH